MSNMSYCKFQNTLQDLRDCEESLNDTDLSREEFVARSRLIKLCLDIVQNSYDLDTETGEYESSGDWEAEDDD